jgi:hypothetical protein
MVKSGSQFTPRRNRARGQFSHDRCAFAPGEPLRAVTDRDCDAVCESFPNCRSRRELMARGRKLCDCANVRPGFIVQVT